jgi:hypothetical protein
MLGTLGLKILVLEDEAATQRTLALRTPVQASQQRCGVDGRLRRMAKMLSSETSEPPALKIVSDRQKAPQQVRLVE